MRVTRLKLYKSRVLLIMVRTAGRPRGEVLAYTKLFGPMSLKTSYYKANSYAGLHTPDFLIRTRDGFWLVETKGAIFDGAANVPLKAEAAHAWCEKVAERMKAKGSRMKGLIGDE